MISLVLLLLLGGDLHVSPDAEPVTLGKAFRLTVTRVWTADEPTPSWDPSRMAPLVVKEVDVRVVELDDRVEETRIFEAWAFGLDEIAGDGWSIRVARSLDPGDASALAAAEPLVGLMDAPSRPWWSGSTGFTMALVALLAATGAFALFVARRRSSRVTPAADARALARIEDPAAGPDDVADAVRGFLAESLALPAPRRSTEELLASDELATAVDAPTRTLVADLLGVGDDVKFARRSIDGARRTEHRERAAAFIRATLERET